MSRINGASRQILGAISRFPRTGIHHSPGRNIGQNMHGFGTRVNDKHYVTTYEPGNKFSYRSIETGPNRSEVQAALRKSMSATKKAQPSQIIRRKVPGLNNQEAVKPRVLPQLPFTFNTVHAHNSPRKPGLGLISKY